MKNFWKSIAYNTGGHIFTLDDIEHGILRGNTIQFARTMIKDKLGYGCDKVMPHFCIALGG